MDHEGQPAINNQQRPHFELGLVGHDWPGVGASCATRALRTPLLGPFAYVTASLTIGLAGLPCFDAPHPASLAELTRIEVKFT